MYLDKSNVDAPILFAYAKLQYRDTREIFTNCRTGMLFIHLIQNIHSCTRHDPFDIVPYQANELSEIILAPYFF